MEVCHHLLNISELTYGIHVANAEVTEYSLDQLRHGAEGAYQTRRYNQQAEGTFLCGLQATLYRKRQMESE